MDDSRNDAGLPQEGESRSHREQTAPQSHTNNIDDGELPSSTQDTDQVENQPAAEPTRGAEPSQPNPNGQEEPQKPKGKPGPPSPFEPYWETDILPLLEWDLAAEITPSGILNNLEERYPEAFEGKVRKNLLDSLRRRVKKWREEHLRGLPKRWIPCPRSLAPGRRGRRPVVKFPQHHPPGIEAQVDFTDCKDLGVTIQGDPYPHELFVFRTSHAGWTYGEVFLAETVSALMQGLQNAMQKLGGAPQVVRSDNRRNAIRNKQPIEPYGAFLKHYGLRLSLINYGRPNENGGVEGENGRVKENVRQALLIRDSRDFESEEDYAAFVARVVDLSNQRHECQHKLQEERASLRPLPDTPAPVCIDMKRKVDDYGLINVYSCRYSVPCRAVGQWVTVLLYAEHMEIYDEKQQRLVTWRRRHGTDQYIICYRHLFPDLVIKWGGFAGLPPEYKAQLFPQPSFRKAHEKLREWDPDGKKTNGMKADYEYVQILQLASDDQRENAADQALQELLKAGHPFDSEDVKRLVDPPSEASEGSPPKGPAPQDKKKNPPRQTEMTFR